MSVSYRIYNQTDKEQLKNLLVQLAISIASKNQLRRKEPAPEYSEYYLNKQLQYVKKDQGIIYVAEYKNKLIGCGIGIIKKQTKEELMEFKNIKKGFISDLVVNKDFQGKGIGSKLMQLLEQYFKNKKCQHIELNVLLANENAHKLYQKLGYVDYDVNMVKKL